MTETAQKRLMNTIYVINTDEERLEFSLEHREDFVEGTATIIANQLATRPGNYLLTLFHKTPIPLQIPQEGRRADSVYNTIKNWLNGHVSY